MDQPQVIRVPRQAVGAGRRYAVQLLGLLRLVRHLLRGGEPLLGQVVGNAGQETRGDLGRPSAVASLEGWLVLRPERLLRPLNPDPQWLAGDAGFGLSALVLDDRGPRAATVERQRPFEARDSLRELLGPALRHPQRHPVAGLVGAGLALLLQGGHERR